MRRYARSAAKRTGPRATHTIPEGSRETSHLSASCNHDAANRLRENDDACYDYDANGNLTTKRDKVAGACTGDVTAYEWDGNSGDTIREFR